MKRPNAASRVLAYKLGRSAEAAELAVSHTGALAGEDDIADAFLKDCGIARVETLEAALEALPLLARLPVTQTATRRMRVWRRDHNGRRCGNGGGSARHPQRRGREANGGGP
jgi:hypothetical protein